MKLPHVMAINNRYIKPVKIDYTNWRGERDVRVIMPQTFYFGCNEWHPEPQMLLGAYDEKSKSVRTFATKNIHTWEPCELEE